MQNTMTVQDFIEAGNKARFAVYLKTAWGMMEVDYIQWPDRDPWAHCPKANGGFGQTFCVHYGTLLYY
jgi:hypothetical protein